MFKDDLFTILTEEITAQHAVFDIRLNAQHSLYTGHFPNDPITPGVCIVQIATDLFSYLQQRDCSMTAAKNVKFLNLIKPTEHSEVRYTLDWDNVEENTYKVKAVASDENTVFAKLSITVVVH